MGRNRTTEGITPIRQFHSTNSISNSNINTAASQQQQQQQQKLPYYHCRISLVNTLISQQDAGNSVVSDREGHLYDAKILMAMIRKYHRNPISGKEMKLSDVIPVHFTFGFGDGDANHAASDDAANHNHHDIICPITQKSLSGNKIKVALIATTGNVFSYTAIQEMNLKTRNYHDLLSHREFDPEKDIIILQDPEEETSGGIRREDPSQYWFVRERIAWKELLEPSSENSSSDENTTKHYNAATKLLLQEAEERERQERQLQEASRSGSSKPQKMLFEKEGRTQKHLKPSLTSTAAEVDDSAEKISDKQAQYKRIATKKQKGFVRLNTSLGALDFELYAHIAPMACENFIVHAKNGYYNGVIFHRVIPKFMAQGGDPTGTGRGGQSIWNKPFEDEFDDRLVFDSRGILACANKGKATNQSQFFITFAPTPHLNKKHTIFGKIIKGDEVLSKFESVKTGAKNRPINPPVIESIIVTVDPFEKDVKKQEQRKRKEAVKEATKEESNKLGQWYSKPQPKLEPVRSGATVGKYLKLPGASSSAAAAGDDIATTTTTTASSASSPSNIMKRKRGLNPQSSLAPSTKKRRQQGQFDFSNW